MEFTGVTELVAVLSPFVVEHLVVGIKSRTWKVFTAFAVASAIALVYTVLGAYHFFPIEQIHDLSHLVEVFVVASVATFGSQQLAYQLLFRGSKVQKSINSEDNDEGRND